MASGITSDAAISAISYEEAVVGLITLAPSFVLGFLVWHYGSYLGHYLFERLSFYFERYRSGELFSLSPSRGEDDDGDITKLNFGNYHKDCSKSYHGYGIDAYAWLPTGGKELCSFLPLSGQVPDDWLGNWHKHSSTTDLLLGIEF